MTHPIEISPAGLDLNVIRTDFPILNRKVNGKRLVYLDNAASSQMPNQVIRQFERYHSHYHSNVHRGVHTLSQEATEALELARGKVKSFIKAPSQKEIIFTYGATDSINLVMQSWGRHTIKKGDEILISNLEHHANIVPWYMLAQEIGAVIKVIPMDDNGDLILSDYEALFNDRTRLVAINHVSNALGTVNPIKAMIETAHRHNALVMVDGAQAVPHMNVDVTDLDCDFYAFSGHKMFGPTGVGVLFGKEKHLASMPPYRGGGDMILSVSFQDIIYNDIPYKFEAGTPPIAQIIMLGYTIDYLNDVGMHNISAYESMLLDYATEKLSSIPNVRLIGTSKNKASVLSFIVDNIHPHDIGTMLDNDGIAVRTGHHCAQPVMERFNIPATTRASFAFYNLLDEVDQLELSLKKTIRLFS